MIASWLTVEEGEAPLVLSMPHTGDEIPADIESRLVSPWLGRKDADWHVHKLYDFGLGLGATTVRTAISRTVIDVNRDPSGASLYPGQATTELCPVETFDGEPLYRSGLAPGRAEVEQRRAAYFDSYHEALGMQIKRLRRRHDQVVIFDAHSIRSNVPRLFDGQLPQFNIGTNGGTSCDPLLRRAIEQVCEASGRTWVTDGCFKGGWITRRYGDPSQGIHAVQMELACRGYMDDPPGALTADNWPTTYDAAGAAALRATLLQVLEACLTFVRS